MLFALLLAPLQPELAPLDFLVGHCWRGEIKPGQFDTHCFTATDAGVRDRHEVTVAGKTVYWGETDYRWDAAAAQIRFVYRNQGGVVGQGAVRGVPGALDFGSTDYAIGTTKVTVSSRWVRVGEDAYDAVDTAPNAAEYNHTTRYVRQPG